MPPATAAGARVEDRPRLGQHPQRARDAGARRDVGVGEDAQREQAGALGHRARAVEVALVLRRAAGEVEHELVPADLGAQPQLEVALARLEHVDRLADAVVHPLELRPRPPLGVVEHRLGRLGQPAGAEPLGQLGEPPRARRVRRQLRAQVGAPLLGLAHPLGQLVDEPRGQGLGRDDHALLLERRRVGRHRARDATAHVGVVRPAGGEADQRPIRPRPPGEDRGDDRDVGQVRPAGERVVEDPRAAGLVLLVEHRCDGRGHRAEVHGDVLGLHDHLAARVEDGGRAVAPLLDVRGVRRADEHGAHLLARGAQRAGHHLQLNGVDRAPPSPGRRPCPPSPPAPQASPRAARTPPARRPACPRGARR